MPDYQKFFSSSTMAGRLLEEPAETVCWFDVCLHLADGSLGIQVRTQAPHRDTHQIPTGANVRVQLFEQPDIWWVARAVRFGNSQIPMIQLRPTRATGSNRRPRPSSAFSCHTRANYRSCFGCHSRPQLHAPHYRSLINQLCGPPRIPNLQ